MALCLHLRRRLGRLALAAALLGAGALRGDADSDLRERVASAERHWQTLRERPRLAASAVRETRGELMGLARELDQLPAPEQSLDLVRKVRTLLGDSWWGHAGETNWGAAWSHYQAVLESYARDHDLDSARAGYLELVRRLSGPPPGLRADGSRSGPPLPVEVLQEALSLARAPEDQARFQFFLALSWRDRARTPAERIRATAALEQALTLAADTPWEASALYAAALWRLRDGRVEEDERGDLRFRPDPAAAARLLDRFLAVAPEQSELLDAAVAQRAQLARPALRLELPVTTDLGHPAAARLTVTNLPEVTLRAEPVALAVEHLGLPPGPVLASAPPPVANQTGWERVLSLPETPAHETWHPTVADWPVLAPGAWLVTARGGELEDRALLVVTDLALQVLVAPDRVLAWVTRASGAHALPVADAVVRLLDAEGRLQEGRTGADGVAVFPQAELASGPLRVTAEQGGRVAWAITPTNSPGLTAPQTRPVLTNRLRARPGDQVRWTLPAPAAARPSAEPWRLLDERGETVAQGAFFDLSNGWIQAAWTVPPTAPAGAHAWSAGGANEPQLWLVIDPAVGSPPDWSIQLVAGPEGDGFGVRQWQLRARWRGAPTDLERPRIRARLRLAPQGLAPPPLSLETVSEPTPERAAELVWVGEFDLAVDGSGAIDVPLPPVNEPQRLWAEAWLPLDRGRGRAWVARDQLTLNPAAHQVVVRVGQTLQTVGTPTHFEVQTRDRDGQPVAVRGTVRLESEQWTERWIDREGRVVLGPPPAAERRPWWSIPLGGRGEVTWQPIDPLVSVQSSPAEDLVTGRDGKVSWTAPELPPGRHRLTWNSYDLGGAPVSATAEVWVVAEDATDLPFRTEPDLRVAATATELLVLVLGPRARSTQLLTVRYPDRWAEWQVVRSELGSHLIRLPLPSGPVRLDLQDPAIAEPLTTLWHLASRSPDLLAAAQPARWSDQAGGHLQVSLAGDAPPPGTGQLAWALVPVRPETTAAPAELTVTPWPAGQSSWTSPLLTPPPGPYEFTAVVAWQGGDFRSAQTLLTVAAPARLTLEPPGRARPGDRFDVVLRLPGPALEHPPELSLTAAWEGPQPPFVIHLPQFQQSPASTVERWQVSLPLSLPDPGAVLRLTGQAGATEEGVLAEASVPLAPTGRPLWAAASGRAADGDVWTIFPPPGARSGRIMIRAARDLEQVLAQAATAIRQETATDPVQLALQAVTPARLASRPPPEPTAGERSAAQAATLLRAIQLLEGGWAPWQSGSPDPVTTAAVVFFLRQAGDAALLELGAGARLQLRTFLTQAERTPAELAWLLTALTAPAPGPAPTRADPVDTAAYLDLMAVADTLPPGAQAALAAAAVGLGFEDDARLLMSRLAPPGWFEQPGSDGRWLRPVGPLPAGWPATAEGEDPALATAMVLFAASLIESPERLGELAVEALLARREGADWGSPAASGLALVALGRWQEAQRATAPATGHWRLEDADGGVEFTLSEQTPAATLVLPWPQAESPRTLSVRRLGGAGEPALSLLAEWLREGGPASASPGGLVVERSLQHRFAEPTLLRGPVERRVPAGRDPVVTIGDVLEVVYVLNLPEDMPAVVLTEYLPSGFRPTSPTRDRNPMVRELRPAADEVATDDPERFTGRLRSAQLAPSLAPSAWVVEDIPAGRWEFRLRWLATHAGTFVLPAAELAPLHDRPRPARSAASTVTVRPVER